MSFAPGSGRMVAYAWETPVLGELLRRLHETGRPTATVGIECDPRTSTTVLRVVWDEGGTRFERAFAVVGGMTAPLPARKGDGA